MDFTHSPRLSDKKKYLFFSELHSLLGSGLSFSRSFELLIEGEKDKKEVLILQQVFHSMLSGSEFWRSMKESEAFSELDYGVTRIGEETGKMAQTLLFLSDYYRKKEEQRRMVVNALSYPVIILMVAVLVLVFMLLVVVPMFEQVYARMGSTLPEITRFMLRLSSYFPTVLLVIAIGGGSLFAVRYLYGETENYRRRSSSLLLHLPLLGNLMRKHYQAQFCKLLHLLVSSNVPLLRSLTLLQGIIRFYPYSHSFAEVAEGLKRGESFSANLQRFPAIYGHKLLTLIRVGEETNTLGDMLRNQSVDITAELEHEIKQVNNILEPLLIVFIGVLVAFVLIAMYMPMFQLGQTIG
jgi:type IV pilus assembly protein PilC